MCWEVLAMAVNLPIRTGLREEPASDRDLGGIVTLGEAKTHLCSRRTRHTRQ